MQTLPSAQGPALRQQAFPVWKTRCRGGEETTQTDLSPKSSLLYVQLHSSALRQKMSHGAAISRGGRVTGNRKQKKSHWLRDQNIILARTSVSGSKVNESAPES